MSVALEGEAIVLSGRCLAEDAEYLLSVILDEPGKPIDVTGVERMHAAVLQVLLALAPDIRGAPNDPFLRDIVFRTSVN